MRMNEELCILLVFPRLLAGRSLSGLPCTYCKEKIDGTDEGFVVDEILIAFPGGKICGCASRALFLLMSPHSFDEATFHDPIHPSCPSNSAGTLILASEAFAPSKPSIDSMSDIVATVSLLYRDEKKVRIREASKHAVMNFSCIQIQRSTCLHHDLFQIVIRPPRSKIERLNCKVNADLFGLHP